MGKRKGQEKLTTKYEIATRVERVNGLNRNTLEHCRLIVIRSEDQQADRGGDDKPRV